MKRGMIRKEMARISGITPRMVQYYTDTKIIVPEIENPIGRGTVRRYSRRNLFEFLLIKRLVSSGVHLLKMPYIIKNLPEYYSVNDKILFLVIKYRHNKSIQDVEVEVRSSPYIDTMIDLKEAMVIDITEIIEKVGRDREE